MYSLSTRYSAHIDEIVKVFIFCSMRPCRAILAQLAAAPHMGDANTNPRSSRLRRLEENVGAIEDAVGTVGVEQHRRLAIGASPRVDQRDRHPGAVPRRAQTRRA